MPSRTAASTIAVIATLAGGTQAAHAQQTLNFTLGYFTVTGVDARVENDVLLENRVVRVFDIDDFNGASVGGEWLIPLGEYFEAGAGISFSRRTVDSFYAEFEDVDGSDIEQEQRLRLVPVAFTVRVLPLRQTSPVQPYLGAGVGLIAWRYSDVGEFIDFQRGNAIFPERYVASGSATGPVFLGGLRFAGDVMSGGFEIRYHNADVELGHPFTTFLRDPHLDLGGWTYAATIGWRFGGP